VQLGKAFQRSTRSSSNSLTGRFSKACLVGRFVLLAFLLAGMVGGASALTDGFEDGDYTNYPEWDLITGSSSNAYVQGSPVFNGDYALGLDEDSGDSTTLRYDLPSGKTLGDHNDGETLSMYIRPAQTGSYTYMLWHDESGRTEKGTIGIDFGEGVRLHYNNKRLNSYGSYSADEWYRYDLTVYPSQDEANFYVEELSTGNVLVDQTVSNSWWNATNLQLVTNNFDQTYYFDDIDVNNFNDAPQFNSSSVSPDPPLIGENVSYSFQGSDSDGTVQSGELTVFKDGSQVFQDTQSFSSSSVSYTWSDVYVPSSS